MGQSAHLGDDVPRSIGGYELLAPIGEGGMGRVFLGRRSVVGGVHRNYAIKLLHANLRAQRDVADQLLEEAKLAAQITHPNVVQVLQGGEEDGHVFVVMEYLEAVTLAHLVRHAIDRGRPIPLGVVSRIVSDALAGLHAAHEALGHDGLPLGLVHRDFSPQNILVGADGIAKLTDFGIAKAISRIGATATGIVKGKVAYLSPEQAMGQSLDRRSDVWAAGVVLWEALARRRLFDESTDTATLLRIVSGPRPSPPSSVWPEIPEAVDQVVLSALERDREARIRDAEELRQRLVQAVGLEHRLAHHVEVADYVAGPVADQRQRVDVEVRRALDGEEPTGPTSVVRPLPPRPPQPTLPLDLVEEREGEPEELDDDVPTRPSSLPPGERDDEIPTAPQAPSSLRGRAGPATVSTPPAPALPSAPSPSQRRGLVLPIAVAVGVVAVLVAAILRVTRDEALPLTAGLPVLPVPVLTQQAREVQVVADEPIAQLSIGETHRLIPEPREAIAFPLAAAVGEEGLAVVAVTADGRKARGRLAAGQRRLELRFPEPEPAPEVDEPATEPSAPPPKRPVAVRPRPARPRPKPKPKAPGLGPSPY